MAKTLNVRIQVRSDTLANWTLSNPILLPGEITYVTDVGKFKVGDGTSDWQSLNYASEISKVSQLKNDAGYAPIQVGTTEQWKVQTGTASKSGTIYVVTDYYIDDDGVTHPGIKIGDGKAYIGDLPVVEGYATDILNHIQNKTIHITSQERQNWNNKVTCQVEGSNLIFKH